MRRSPGSRQQFELDDSPLMEHEECTGADERKADGVIPAKRFFEVKRRKSREYKKCDHLLHRLELGNGVNGAAVTVGRDHQAIFEEGNAPTCQDSPGQRRLAGTQMPVPGVRHEQIGAEQKQDRRQPGGEDEGRHGANELSREDSFRIVVIAVNVDELLLSERPVTKDYRPVVSRLSEFAAVVAILPLLSSCGCLRARFGHRREG